MTVRKYGREDWSLFYCDTGLLFVGDHTVLKAGQVWIYGPRTPQKYTTYASDKTTYFYLHFVGSDVPSLLANLGISESVVLDTKTDTLSDIFDRIHDSVEDGTGLSQVVAEYSALRLLAKISRKTQSVSDPHILKQVTDHMEHSFAVKYDPQQYAQMLKMSKILPFKHQIIAFCV